MKSLALAVLAIALITAAPAMARPEYIIDFTSEISVEKSGDLNVTETITALAGGNQIKHGIYRDFPTLYQSVLGLNRRVAFDVLDVQCDGKEEPWHTKPTDSGVRVYIGDANQFLHPGPHVYTLRYRTNRQLVQRPDFDELYWNVTGNQWSFPIDHAEAKVSLPLGAIIKAIDAYTGPTGSRGQAWRTRPAPQGSAAIETTSVLNRYEGFTISVEWQKGIVDANANHQTLLDIALDNRGLALALAGTVLVLTYYFVAWVRVGRDPARGVIIPLYKPPDGFSPAAVRYLEGMGKFDQKSFAASVIDLAVNGALSIRQNKDKTYLLQRTKTGIDHLALAQRTFFRSLLGSRDILPVDQTEHVAFAAARKNLLGSLRSEIEKRYFLRHSGWWLGGLALSLLPALVALNDAHDIGLAGFMVVWLSFWSIGTFALCANVVSQWWSGNIPAALRTTLFAIPFLGGWGFGVFLLVKATSPWIAGVFLLAIAINAVFYQLLKAPTFEGRRAMDAIEGFRRYLGIAERDRLNLENPPERTPAHYEMFLPYALALDVEQQWSAQFAEVLKAAQYDPGWYQGSTGAFNLSAVAFASSLGGAFTEAMGSSSSAPGSSSGGDGGGSSGGGGGGGGGGGW